MSKKENDVIDTCMKVPLKGPLDQPSHGWKGNSQNKQYNCNRKVLNIRGNVKESATTGTDPPLDSTNNPLESNLNDSGTL